MPTPDEDNVDLEREPDTLTPEYFKLSLQEEGSDNQTILDSLDNGTPDLGGDIESESIENSATSIIPRPKYVP